MANQSFTSEKIRQYRKFPIESDLVLIDTGKKPFGSSTFVFRIIRQFLSDAASSVRVALITDQYEIYQSGIREFERDSRLSAIIPETDAYYRAYCTAGRIYSAGWLPDFYSKRKGQRISLFLPPDQFVPDSGFARPAINRQVTLRSADEIIDTSPAAYFRDIPADVLRDTLLVYFTANGPLYGSDMLNLIQFHKAAGGVAAALRYKLIYIVPPALWKVCHERRESLPFENMVPATADLAPLMASAVAALTVPGRFLTYAQERNIPCLIYNGRVQEAYPACSFVYSWEGIESAFRSFVMSAAADQPPVSVPEQNRPAPAKHALVIADWDVLEPYQRYLQFLQDNAAVRGYSVDILLRTIGKTSQKTVEKSIPENLEVSLYTDDLYVEPEKRELLESGKDSQASERELREAVQTEWTRILGNPRYDLVLAQENTSGLFWNNMHRFLPGDENRILSITSLPETLAPLLIPAPLRRFENKAALLPEMEYRGKCYYRLGHQKKGLLYCEKTYDKNDYILYFYTGGSLKSVLDIRKTRFPESSLVIINTEGKRIPPLNDRKQYTELNITGLPLSLLLRCRLFLCPQDCPEAVLGVLLSVPTETPEGDAIPPFSNCELLKLTEKQFWNRLIWDDALPDPLNG